MDPQANEVDAFFEMLRIEDFEINKWQCIVLDWMSNYEDFFDEEDEEDEEDEYRQGGFDEGFLADGDGIERRALQRGLDVFSGRALFCKITTRIRIRGRRFVCNLCPTCYLEYLESYGWVHVEHQHVMDHMVMTLDFGVTPEKCSSCDLPISQVILREACLICN